MKPKAGKITKAAPGKRTRGYRLKPSTHTLIVKIQKILKSDQDVAIANACNMYYTELSKSGITK